ncbi:MAG: hypothetical protein U0325_04825 [Polyangiales bacterium]
MSAALANTTCPRCAATIPPGTLVCGYCNATLASLSDLGPAARALDARFDTLAAASAALLAAQTLPAVTAKTLHVALGAASSNAMRLRDLLEAQARVIPAPTSPQDVAVWLNRAPSLAWLSYTALGYTRSVPAAPLPDVLAGVLRERAAWASRDKGLVAVFAQREADARRATPTLRNGLARFARGNPLLALALAAMCVWAVVRWLSPMPSRTSRRRRRAEVQRVVPAIAARVGRRSVAGG